MAFTAFKINTSLQPLPPPTVSSCAANLLLQRKVALNREREREKKNCYCFTAEQEREGACDSGAIIFSNLLMAADHLQPAAKGLSANDLSTMKTTTQITEREVYS